MEITANDFVIKLNSNELYDLASNVKWALVSTVKNHWVSHPCSYREQEKNRLELLKSLYSSLGRYDLYESTIEEIEVIIAKAIDSQTKH